MESPQTRNDDAAVTSLGYVQKLDRSLSRFALFALQFSYISVLTTMFLLFGFAYGFAGPSLIWPWAAFFAGQMLVTLLFCELASRYPVAGSVYNWSKQLGSPWMAWMAGWMMVLLGPITLAAVALPAQTILPAISPAFQVIGSASNPHNYAENAVLLGGILILLTTALNCARVRLMGRTNNVTVIVELIVCALLIVLLFAHAQRTPAVVFNTLGLGKGMAAGYLGAFLVASLLGGYQFYGMDTASSLAEESPDPQRRAPRAILIAMFGSFALGLLLLIAAVVAVPSITDGKIATLGLPYVVDQVLGSGVGNVLLVGALVAVFGCALAVQAGGVRIVFGMARDNGLPLSHQAARVSGTTKAITWPAIVVGSVAIVLLVINIGSTQIIAIISAAAIATCAVAYLFVTVPLLIARLKGTWPTPDSGRRLFSLGRLGLPINILAVVWGVAITVNLLWPRQIVFNPTPPFHWYLDYGPLLYMGVVLLGGSAYYVLAHKSRHEILVEHRGSVTEQKVQI
jgi:urea carboxylase system permease